MKKSTDLRAKRTRRWLQNALQKLMKTKPYRKITIGEIVHKAEVARPTFYLHYASKDELLMSVFDDFFIDFKEAIERELKRGSFDYFLLGKILFSCTGNNAEGLRILFDAGVDSLVEQRFKAIVRETGQSIRTVEPLPSEADILIPYLDDFASGGFFALLKRWIQEGQSIPHETMGLVVANVAIGLSEMIRDEDFKVSR